MCYFVQINNDLEYIHKDWFCKKCSRRFNKFVEEFVECNTEYPRHFRSMRHRNIQLRKDDKNFKDGIQFLLTLLQDFKDALSDKSYAGSDKIKEFKFPIIQTNYDILNDFYKTLPKNKKSLSFNDLEDFYTDCYMVNYMRKDIYDNELSFHHSEIEFLEKTYKVSYSHIHFPREEELGEETMEEFLSTYYDWDNEDIREHYDDIDSEGYVGTIKYSRTKSILLNYLSYLYCDRCVNSFNYLECIGERIYIASSIVATLYNSMCGNIQYKLLHTKKYDKFRAMISTKLNEMKNCWKHAPFCVTWKGFRRYYELMGLLPKLLRDIGIPEEHYIYRLNTYFSDHIAGHPMASHGWCAEALNELIEIGAL